MNVKRIWHNFSLSNKLYVVVGFMAFLVATELFTLLFAMETLSTARAFVNGESLWSKAQKEAVINLYDYARTRDPIYYKNFHQELNVIMGDRLARENIMGPDSFNREKVTHALLRGKNNSDDIPGLIYLLDIFNNFRYVREALDLWIEADLKIDELVLLAKDLHQQISNQASAQSLNSTLDRVKTLNQELTLIESRFSSALGEGSRWLQYVLLLTLFCAVLAVETTGLILTFSITRSLAVRLRELREAAGNLGSGNLEWQIPVRSNDDLSLLATTLNKMASDLKNSEKANRLKSLFLANMSHEMRTPLGAILGFTKLLQDPTLPAEDREEYIDIIEKTGESLTKIINDILDLSKVEAGYLEIEKKDFSLREVLKEVRILCEAKLGKKQVSVLVDIQEPFPDYINTDPQRLQQILMNILGNAIKFTEHGYVKIVGSATATHLNFKIEDTGVGIPLDKQHLLFKSFSQVDNSLSRKHEGTGLGLVLSRHLARMLDGDVVLEESQFGRGTTFAVTIPYTLSQKARQEQSAKEETAKALRQINGKSVLLVDDSEINRLLINRILSNQNIKVTMAENGEEAISKAKSHEFDVILMDVQMPVMDGRTATRLLRASGYSKPIIALTAHAMKEDRDRCIEAGCNDYLTKPVDFEALFRTMAKYIIVTPKEPQAEA